MRVSLAKAIAFISVVGLGAANAVGLSTSEYPPPASRAAHNTDTDGKLEPARANHLRANRIATTLFELLLEVAPATQVLEFLGSRYPAVKFRPHPTMNGFYASGSLSDLLAVRDDVQWLDQEAFLAPFPGIIALKHISAVTAVEAIKVLVPEANCGVGVGALIHEGPAQTRAEVLIALAAIDRPSIHLRVSRTQLAAAPRVTATFPKWEGGSNAPTEIVAESFT